MILNLKSTFESLFADQQGNLTIVTAIMSLMIMTAAALALDTTRFTQAKTLLRDANDAATLAAAREFGKTQREREEIYENTLRATLSMSNVIDDYGYEVSFSESKGSVELNSKAWADADYLFPDFGGERRKIEVESQALTGKIKLEIALALDLTGMRNNQKMKEVKKAATRFVEIILKDSYYKENATISLIPYTGTVRLPEGMDNFLKTPPTNNHWIEKRWNGCLSYQRDELKNGLNPRKRYDYMPDFLTWSQHKPEWCPVEGSNLLGPTSDSQQLLDHIDNLSIGYGSGSDHAMAWAYATLDPNWRGKFPNGKQAYPLNYNNRYKKVVILMTTGKANDQRIPTLAEANAAPPPVRTTNITYSQFDARKILSNLCDISKSKDIEIFSVAFDTDDNQAKNEMKDCASSDMHYHDALSKELEATYEEIASYLSSLRLTK